MLRHTETEAGHPMTDPDPSAAEDRTSLVTMTRADCVELLIGTPIGRVVFIDDGHPLALPVNYR